MFRGSSGDRGQVSTFEPLQSFLGQSARQPRRALRSLAGRTFRRASQVLFRMEGGRGRQRACWVRFPGLRREEWGGGWLARRRKHRDPLLRNRRQRADPQSVLEQTNAGMAGEIHLFTVWTVAVGDLFHLGVLARSVSRVLRLLHVRPVANQRRASGQGQDQPVGGAWLRRVQLRHLPQGQSHRLVVLAPVLGGQHVIHELHRANLLHEQLGEMCRRSRQLLLCALLRTRSSVCRP